MTNTSVRNAIAAAFAIAFSSCPAIAAPAYTDRISVAVSGKGEDVVLIPGLASSSHVWDATVAQLSPHYRVHAVQVAGFAGTPPKANGSGPVLEPTLAAIHDYIVAAHLRSPAVIGHSLGGLMAMKLAIEHPSDVGRLMIVDSLPFLGLLAGPQASVAAVQPRAQAMRAKLNEGTQAEYAQSAPATMSGLVKSNGPDAQAAISAAASSDHRVVAEAMYDDFTTDLRPQLAQIKVPVTMLYPWDTRMGVPAATFDALYHSAFAALPQATLQRIDGSFHFIMIDQKQAFATAVDRFLTH